MTDNLHLLQEQDKNCNQHTCLVDVLYWIDFCFLIIYVLDVVFKVNFINNRLVHFDRYIIAYMKLAVAPTLSQHTVCYMLICHYIQYVTFLNSID